MATPKADYDAAYIDIRLTDNPEVVVLAFFDQNAQLPHLVSFPSRRLAHLEDQARRKRIELRPAIPEA